MKKTLDLTEMNCLDCNLPYFNCICVPKKQELFDFVIQALVEKYLKKRTKWYK